jgi:hypothetical protein
MNVLDAWAARDALRVRASHAIRQASALLRCDDPDELERIAAGDDAAMARVLGCPMCGREPDRGA